MKNLFRFPVLVLGLILLMTGATQKAIAQDDDISLQTFYDELSPYGTWIQDAEYGYVWRPDVDQRDFRPYYTNGRWAMTEYGNTWVSDYDWGWAPFHYGRWVNNRYNQWLWIPDTTWGPAWVSWRSGGGYYGWAPLSPGINININLGGGYHIPNSYWVFVPQRNIYYDRFPSYRSYRNVTIINNTTIINYTGGRNRNTYYTGPRRDDIRRATNRDVTVYRVNRSDRSGRSTISNNTVNIYNPRSNRTVDNSNAAPKRVSTERSNVTPRSDRSTAERNTANREGVSTRSNAAERATERNTDRSNRTESATPSRANREAATNRTATERPTQTQQQRTQRDAPAQQQLQKTRESQAQAQQQQQERTQREAQNRQQQATRENQAQAQQQERARQVQSQQQQQERSQREAQSRPQQRTQSAPREQVQPQRQERAQQSAPTRSGQTRSSAPAQSSSRSARGDRG